MRGSPVRLVHRMFLFATLGLGVAWSACLMVAGLHAVVLAWAGAAGGLALGWLGAAGVAAGNFVFMEVVADRVVRARRRKPMDLTEILTAGAMVLSLLLAAVVWFRGTLI